jgi:hypothetical protein
MRQLTVGRHVNGKVVTAVSLAIDTALCPVDVALAQVTIIPGTDDDDDNFEDDIEDGGDESEEIPEGVVEDETTSSAVEIAGGPFQSSFVGTLTGNPKIT